MAYRHFNTTIEFFSTVVATSSLSPANRNSEYKWVSKLHFSNIPSVGAPNQCLCGSEAFVLVRVF
jgi:hypothetical protein